VQPEFPTAPAYEIEKLPYEACDIEARTIAGALVQARVLTAYAEVEIVVGHYRGPIWVARRSCAGAIDRATERLNDAARRFTPGGLFLAVCWMTDLSCHRC